MKLNALLEMYGLDLNRKIKIVRHKDENRGYDLQKLYQLDQLNIYQSFQKKDVFSECDFIVTFLGLENSKALFVGVYEVKNTRSANEVPIPKHFHYYESFKQSKKFYYDMNEVEGFDDLKDRLIIKWSGNAINWHQWLKNTNMEVIQILPKGYIKSFTGYMDVVLTHPMLKKIIENPDANQDWHQMLSNVAGVYLIVDTNTGLQYVGSAYGKDGILGRWKDYAKNGHGDNKELMKLVQKDPSYSHNFQFSILETLSKSLTKNEVLIKEKKWKEKLGSKAHGLNLN
ncbi:GIY-YIG nuclease family protein [Bacillus smithii]|uniref:GIY-YIG nuclease family protein n=1 Tax=Bacillus smithii TaxID=1479 RepID=UPI002E213DC0|nr:GIY-YIG nuclease family protein [Bacillus smithii]MED1457789.1 GIY-YIG nuclease family protein [Bacillus smithii]